MEALKRVCAGNYSDHLFYQSHLKAEE